MKDWSAGGAPRPSVRGLIPDADGIVAGNDWGEEFDITFKPIGDVLRTHDAAMVLATAPAWGRLAITGSFRDPQVAASNHALEAAWRASHASDGGSAVAPAAAVEVHRDGTLGFQDAREALSAGTEGLGVRLRTLSLAPLAGTHGFRNCAFYFLQLVRASSVRITLGPPDTRFDIPRADGTLTVQCFSLRASPSSDGVTVPTLASGSPPFRLNLNRLAVQGWQPGTVDPHNFPPVGATFFDELQGGRYVLLVRFDDAAQVADSIQPFVLRVWCKDQFFLRPCFW